MSSWILELTGKLINMQIFKRSASKSLVHFLMVPVQTGPAPLKTHLTQDLTLGDSQEVTIQKKVRRQSNAEFYDSATRAEQNISETI